MSQTSTDRRHEDLQWALTDPAIQETYIGEFVGVFERRVVAHGTDEELVLREATRVTGRPTHELAVCLIPDLLQDIPH